MSTVCLKVPGLLALVVLITVVFRKSTEQRWNDTDRGMRDILEEKPGPVPLCPPQTPRGQA